MNSKWVDRTGHEWRVVVQDYGSYHKVTMVNETFFAEFGRQAAIGYIVETLDDISGDRIQGLIDGWQGGFSWGQWAMSDMLEQRLGTLLEEEFDTSAYIVLQRMHAHMKEDDE
jgi:hypothetical protein